MNRKIASALALFSLNLLAGCVMQPAARNRGPAYGHEELFRQELAGSKPVKEWGYTVEEVRFSNNYRRAIVVFLLPGNTPVHTKAILDYDIDHGYFGRLYKPEPTRSNPLTIGEARAMTADISVNLPAK